MDSQENTLLTGTNEERPVEETSAIQPDNTIEAEETSSEAAAEAVAAVEDTVQKPGEEPSAAQEEAQSAAEETPAAADEGTAATDEEAAAETEQTVTEAEETSAPAEDAAPAAGEEASEQEEDVPNKEEPHVYKTKKEVIARIKEIVANGEFANKEEIDTLKTSFYKIHNAEREERLREYMEAGGDPEKYHIQPDEDETIFKAEMSVIRERRSQLARQQDEEKQKNLEKKLEIIERIKAMATSPEQANKSYQEFKSLQQQWRETKAVPAERSNELWRSYQLCVEQFYDLLKLNNAAREYDFRKNLEIKTKLCEAAERLADEPDVVSAFRQLQELHQQYRETGPVAKDLREDLWTRFKTASTVVNKRHQQHFEGLRAKEGENLERKTELCEKAEAVLNVECKRAVDWEKQAKEIMALQAEWKTIGFAPQKMNVKIFERFHTACDEFFKRKSAFFKSLKATFSENIAKKKALIERAKELSTSTEWKATGDKLIALQKEWKTVGNVPRKVGDRLWEEFLTACNTFFNARKAANGGSAGDERANLDKKRGVIDRMRALKETPGDDPQTALEQLMDEYSAIGHVPYKEKDKLYNEYHSVVDDLCSALNLSVSRRTLDSFKSNLKQMAQRGGDALDNERSRLMRRYDQLRQEIQTYENNLGFLNAASKKGNSLVEEFNRKVKKLKDDLELVKSKVKAIDAEG